jgi:serine/threonine-protein kinase
MRDIQLWSDSYQRAEGQVFLLGSDVALGVTEVIRGQVTSAESARIEESSATKQEAQMYYQRGRFLTSRRTEEPIRSGIEHLERAIELDSSFAVAYTALADALIYLGDVVGTRGDIRPVDYMPRARELVLRALDIDSGLADGHKMFALIRWYYDYDYEVGERVAKLATEMNPNAADAWDYYGMVLSARGRDDEAVAAVRRAIELDPVAPWILSDLSWILIIARRYEEGLRAAQTAMELDPDMVTAIDNAANAHSPMGNHAESIRLHARSAELSENPWHLSGLADAHARAGNRQEALRLLDSLHAINERQYVTPRAFANAYIGLDSLDSAIEWLIRAAELRAPGLNMHIRHPFRDAIRDHPRYPELLRLMRLEP